MSQKSRHRSPRYPSISLPAAIEKLGLFYRKEGRHKVPRETAIVSLGYKCLSGTASGMIGTLCQYGLLEQQKGEINISEDGWIILEAPASSRDRIEAIRRCAQSPNVFRELREKYVDKLPSDATLNWELKNKGFSDDPAKLVIRALRESIEFEDAECGYGATPEVSNVPEVENMDVQNDESQDLDVNATQGCVQNKSGVTPNMVSVPVQEMGPSLAMDIFDDNRIEIRLKRKVTETEWKELDTLFKFAKNTFVEKMI